ncbi:MAG TPA: GcrA family cell cycle regulator, partial [Methylomirabilota bacterium]|nr:GcrA family cell cycle regulator [Methylomirabilota bacterium]
MSWTDERVERLKSLWLEGLSASQIAAELGGVTRNAVIGKVHRLGLSGRTRPQVQSSRPQASARPKGPSRPSAPSAPRPSRPLSIGNVALKADDSPQPRVSTAPVVDEGPVVFERMSILNLNETTCKWPV